MLGVLGGQMSDRNMNTSAEQIARYYALSPEFEIVPFIPPEVKHLSIGLTYPDYTKLKPVTQTSPEITILRGSTAMLHDGRARTVVEAILWHGGEAEKARDAFSRLPRSEREALVKFVESL